MTRFLSRIWNDPLCGTLNQETEHLFNYHQATKHTYQSVRVNARSLDWQNQPNPFRSYEGAPSIMLPSDPGFPDSGTFAVTAALGNHEEKAKENEERGEIPLDLSWLSRLLWHSMAISAWKKAPGLGNRYSLRVNPSSGNLHPTETYLALRGFRDIDDGLYHYRADRHALELRSPGAATERLAAALMISDREESPLIVGLTSIFWREAWKYRDRAYRYCCHDLGHAMMSLLLSARALGLVGRAIAHFGDLRLTQALGLTGSDEAPMVFLVFTSNRSSRQSSLRQDATFLGAANELSMQEQPYELLLDIHRATILPDSLDPLAVPPVDNVFVSNKPLLSAVSVKAPTFDAALAATVRRRRSALDFDPRTSPMARRHVEQLLDFATRDWPADWRGSFQVSATESPEGANFVALYIYIHRVQDCDPGVYQWNRTSRTLDPLHLGNVERVAAYLSLEQSLAGNSCFTISMIANLRKTAQMFGNRGYRYVHFEAGAIGHRLYVGAETLNWNATGIGAFYDDDVHRYLGFLEEVDTTVDTSLREAEHRALVMLDSPASRIDAAKSPDREKFAPVLTGVEAASITDSRALAHQVIYHFAVGRAIPDPRIEG